MTQRIKMTGHFWSIEGIAPHEIMYEEREPLFLASEFSPVHAADECGYLLDEVDVREEWYRPRRLGPVAMADEDVQSWLNPDWEPGDPPAEFEYLPSSPDHRDARRYLRVVPRAGWPS